MANIDDPQVTRFSNEVLRPDCESSQLLVKELEDAVLDFDNDIAPLLSGASRSDTIDDGRASDGSSRLVVGDILDAVNAWRDYIKAFNGEAISASPGRRETQRKPSVRSRAR